MTLRTMRHWWPLSLAPLLAACPGGGPTETVFPDFGEVRVFADHREIDVRFESEGATLGGTLYLPLTGSAFSAVAVNPGSAWDARPTWQEVTPFVLGMNAAVLGWDKRGFGESGGTFFTDADAAAFELLASDVLAGALALREAPLVDPDRIGLVGTSQGGWIVPLAANRDRETVSFNVILVGGAVSTGQEGLYDELTGYSDCERSELSMEEILVQLREAGPSGFDPRASIEALTQPTMWVWGGLDFSHPALFSAEKLEEADPTGQKPWTVLILENANHDLIEGGSICQTEGELADVITPLVAWMTEIFTP